jgi:hypothetical protein
MFFKKTWQEKALKKARKIYQKITEWIGRNRKAAMGAGLVLVAVIAVASIFLLRKDDNRGMERGEPAEYEVAVQVRDQLSSDPAEDARTSLKAGDVVVIQPAGHSWSMTERVSYLILKIKLDNIQKSDLVSPEERELSKKEIKARRPEKWDEMPKEDRKRFEEEEKMRPQTETVRPRKYRIDLEKIGFTDPNSLLNGQPFADKTFDWDVVEKK